MTVDDGGISAGIEIVRHPRARRTRLAVDPATGRVRLTLPPRASADRALAWARRQSAWLDAQRQALPQPRPFVPGAVIPLAGETLTLAWAPGPARGLIRDGNRLVAAGPEETLARRVTDWLKREALATMSADTAEFAAAAGVTVTRVAIGDARGRWGSCASGGTIRYNWRLILAPPAVRRATAAHEVAHRVHMNHGPAFHALVAELYGRAPDAERAWLRRQGAALHWFGRAASSSGSTAPPRG